MGSNDPQGNRADVLEARSFLVRVVEYIEDIDTH
jgi:hypothetical protein